MQLTFIGSSMTKRNKSCESEVMLTMQRKELLKKSAIRYAEYYGMVEVQDALYADSASEKIFTNLISIIGSDANIKMAYRNLKSNKGSSTPGVDGKTFKDLAEMSEEALVQCVRDKILNYQPKAVRRVYIPKPNGKMRPLGIPTVLDRIVQQSVLQVMEPICEAKFYRHSYGFRPNRSTKNAVAVCYKLAQVDGFHYVVDVDIKGFFDNVDHGKLLKQIWTMGIRDKRLISLIGKMLKAPIEENGVRTVRIVLVALRKQLEIFQSMAKILEEGEEKNKTNLPAMQRNMEQELEKLKAERIRQYEAYAEGVVNQETYLKNKKDLNEKIEIIQDKYEQIQEVTSVEDDLMKDIRTVEKNAEEVNILKKMTRHIAETFVEEITIYDSEKIEIRFVFDDLLIGMADRIKKKTEDIA